MTWPNLDAANRLVRAHHAELDGGDYGRLRPATEALAEKYPVAATLLHRALAEDVLRRASSRQYQYAARDVRACAGLATFVSAEDGVAIRFERRLCDEVHLNLAYRWFCRLGLEGAVPDHSTFSKNRHGRFRDSDLFRRLFEHVVRQCMQAGLVGGEGFAIDASVIERTPATAARSMESQRYGRRTRISPGRCASISTPSTLRLPLRPHQHHHRRTMTCRRAIQRPSQSSRR